jgi:hypothetical protein
MISTTISTQQPPEENFQMANKLQAVPESVPVTPADPFDLDALRVSQDFEAMAGVKKQLINVPVRKPNRQDFVRVNPDESYRVNLHVIVLQDDREVYVVRPDLYTGLSNEVVTVTLFTAINRQGVVFLWPVRLPSSDGKTNAWWTSARMAAEQAMTKWVRVSANQSLGAYEVMTAESCTHEPEWPEQSLQELIRIAFRERIIDSIDHPVVKRLRGLT